MTSKGADSRRDGDWRVAKSGRMVQSDTRTKMLPLRVAVAG